MFLLPLRTDRPVRSKPVINIAIIVVNFVVHFMLHKDGYPQFLQNAGSYFLDPNNPRLYQFISSVFLHDSVGHLLGNMLFLYIFGNNMEDRLGRIGYLAYYLAGGVLAGLGHCLFDDNLVLGASGAVAAVTGGFLVLFPMTRITFFFWFFFIGFFHIRSMYVILFYFAQDAIFYLSQFGGVAYMAHISGSIFGFTVCFMLLRTRVLKRETYDMISMLEHRKRRMEFRNLAKSPGFEPWDAPKPGDPPKAFKGGPPSPPIDPVVAQKRGEISRALGAHNLDRACELYAELLDADGEQVLSQTNQLDLANHFAKQERYNLASRAYELLINTYRQLPDRHRIQLMLALIYVRYLQRGQRAKELLADVTPRLRTDDEKAMAAALQTELDQLGI